MRKLAFLVLGFVAAMGGCTEDSDATDPIPTEGVTSQQLEAFDTLRATTHKSWKWVQHEELKTPAHLSTSRIGAATLLGVNDDAKVRTIEVLRSNKALFKMRDPGLELSAIKTERDRYGMQHARFQQVAHGVPVVGAEVMAHYDGEGHLASIDASYVADLDSVDVNPRFASNDALDVVKGDIVGRTNVALTTLAPDDGKLVIYERKLAYEYSVRALAGPNPAIWIYTIDAHTGDILHYRNNLQTVEGQGIGVLGDTKKFQVSNATGGGFVMSVTDPSTQIEIKTFTAKQLEDAPGSLVTSNSATSWDTTGNGRGAAVDAHFNASVVAKYYKEVHGRNSIDGIGGALESTVHFGQQLDNAAWIGTGMIYGDGGELFKALSVSVDVVGHEFTHGVTEKTSNLKYEKQSGALNEAVSDIFGAFIEHSLKPEANANWAIGEDTTRSGQPLRNMQRPGSVPAPNNQPAHMDEFVNTQQDNGGVHINSGIINNAAFLMTVGGTNPVSGVSVKYGIGWEKSEKLWYQANTKYFMSSTNFAAAATALQQAGKDVGLDANDLAIVDCAFKATGIVNGACATITKPASTTGSTDDPATDDAADSRSSGDDDDSPSTSKKKKRKKTIVTEEPGCRATGSSSDLGSLIPLFAAVAAIRATRRRRR